MPLYDFQQDLEDRSLEAWQEPNVFNVMPVLATGGGKTVLVSSVVQKFQRPTLALAHRQELVSQMSLAFNRDGIWHGLVCPPEIQRQIVRLHHDEHGYSRFKYNAEVMVGGIDSIGNIDHRWATRVGLVVVDEGHHVERTNKWGRAMLRFPNAFGYFPTAHGLRGDGHGLGRHASGLVDRMVIGAHARDLIGRGFLTDYDIYGSELDLDFSEVGISPVTGELIQHQLSAVTHKSKQLVGDVVAKYLLRGAGKLGVTFAVDIEEAKKIAAAYNKADVPAEIITSKTPITVRGQLMRQFRERRLLQLVSVDCLGEGVDVPAIEIVSLARRTASFQLFAQQVGRALRTMVEKGSSTPWGNLTDGERLQRIAASRKPKAIINDHVGNVTYFAQWHGRPCSKQDYTMDNTTGKARARRPIDSLRYCWNCAKPCERLLVKCPYCGEYPKVAERATIDQVDGDLPLLDPEMLQSMKQAVAKIDGAPPIVAGSTDVVGRSILKNHYNRQRHQASLRRVMALWGGWRQFTHNEEPRAIAKRFYLTFGVDELSAQALSTPEATGLELRIRDELDRYGVYDPNEPKPVEPGDVLGQARSNVA